MRRYDVIIVGSGPAGAAAAFSLAQKGIETAVLEKSAHPRYKPCGGGLTPKVERVLPFPIREVSERVVYGARLTCRGEGEMVVTSSSPVAYLVMRDSFDRRLAEEARKAGALLFEGRKVTAVRSDGEGFEVRTAEERFACRFLIGADGVHGPVRRALFPTRRSRPAPGLEGEFLMGKERVDPVAGEIRVDFGEVPRGYGWVFPKERHLSVGIGAFAGSLESPKQVLERYLRTDPLLKNLVSRDEAIWTGYPIPTFTEDSPRVMGKALLAGDAGNLVDPFFGEGTYYAIRSGQMAAETVADALRHGRDLGRYDRMLAAELYPEFHAARKLARLVYAAPRFWCRLIADNPELGELYFEALRGNGGYPKFWRELKARAAGVLWTHLKKSVGRRFFGKGLTHPK